MDQKALANRLAMATNLWRESTADPLPRMPPADPATQIEQFELKLVELLCSEATPESAPDVADKTWDMVHDRPEDDPVRKRVAECHEELARLTHGRG